jgi:acetylglutamate kinase
MTTPHDRNLTMEALKRALPYIRLWRGRVFVVKIGGALCGEPSMLADLAGQLSIFREFGIKVVLVHGGGPQTTALSSKLGVETQFVDGRRITDQKTLEIAVMTMNGTINTAILAACRAAELPAVGISGIDAGLIRARRRPPRTKVTGDARTTVDFGEVGDVVAVDVSVLNRLLDSGFTPIVSPLVADDAGTILNMNADTVASTLARELAAEKLIFVQEAPGILEDRDDPSSLVSYTDVRGLNALLERGVLEAGMLPKANAAKEALYGGVKRVHVIGGGKDNLLLEVFTNEGAGTLIVMEMRDLLPAEMQQQSSHVDAIFKSVEGSRG